MTSRLLACALAAVLAQGCATYSYSARGPGPDYSQLPLDKDTPRTSTQWSYLWGMLSHVWSPLDCGPSVPLDQCKQPKDPCDGQGVARFETKVPWYGVPLAVVTLGLAVPADLTIFCSVNQAPGTGP